MVARGAAAATKVAPLCQNRPVAPAGVSPPRADFSAMQSAMIQATLIPTDAISIHPLAGWANSTPRGVFQRPSPSSP